MSGIVTAPKALKVLRGDVVLYQGDCIDVLKALPDGHADLVLTDPPYGISFQSNRRSSETKHRPIANDENLEWLRELIAEAHRVLADNSAAYFFCSWHKIDVFKAEIERHFKIKDVLVWEKNNTSMGDLKGSFAPKVEFILLCHKGRALIRGRRDANIFKFAKTRNKLHPTQKPVDLCEYLISKFSDHGDIVIDPFAGSGTTGVAAVRTGRKFVGIELDAKYFDTCTQRINACLS